jgi:serine/threonine protein kinase
MAALFCSVTGEAITLIREINKSGEGTIWLTNKNEYVAKIYHTLDFERVEKLKLMLAYAPDEPNSHLNHISFAWPKSLLQDSNGWVLGFLMPYITDSKELISIYNPKIRQNLGLEIDWHFLHTVAHNIASIVHAIHSKGYVIGDIKPQNILVNNRALPSIIDTDSFQVRNPSNNKLYHCLVGSEGFTPVELLGQDLSTVEQTEVHDRFRLAVIIYLLLLAEQPFKGLWTGKGEHPEPTELLRKGFWSHGLNSLMKPGPLTIPLSILHPELQRCFQLCFDDGHILPHRRPTAAEWKKALITAREQLINCNLIDRHLYSKSYGKCYWCQRVANIQFDIFPGKAVANQPSQHQFKVFAATNTLELIQQESQEITVEGKILSLNLCHHHFILNFGIPGQKNGYFRIIVYSSSIKEASKLIGVPMTTLTDLIGKIIKVTGKINIKSIKTRVYPQIVLKSSEVTNLNNNNNRLNNKKPLSQPKVKSTKIIVNQSSSTKQLNIQPHHPKYNSVDTSESYLIKAKICAAEKNYNLAIQFYTLAIKLDGNNDILYYNRGNAYYYIKAYQNAVKDYRKALQLNPNNRQAAHNLDVARNILNNII